MEQQKKTWELPQLVVLTRGMPEESVFESCKAIHVPPGTGPELAKQDSCAVGLQANCSNCKNRGGGDS